MRVLVIVALLVVLFVAVFMVVGRGGPRVTIVRRERDEGDIEENDEKRL